MMAMTVTSLLPLSTAMPKKAAPPMLRCAVSSIERAEDTPLGC